MHLACIYIAAKNVEFVPYKKLLSTMLSHVHNQEVDANVAANLELEVSMPSCISMSSSIQEPAPVHNNSCMHARLSFQGVALPCMY